MNLQHSQPNSLAGGMMKIKSGVVTMMKYILSAVTALSIIPSIALASAPATPTGLCIQSSAGTQCVPDTGTKKWHPGHYVGLSAGTTKPGNTFTMSTDMKDAVFTGIKMIAYWKDLESSLGVYDFSTIEAVLNEAQKYGKGLMLEIRDRSFSSCTSSIPVPAYLLTAEYNGGIAGDSNSCIAQVWNSNVIDREIALFQALATRFDNEPYFYGIATEESALNLSTATKTAAGWTDAGQEAEMKRLNEAITVAFVHTPFFAGFNFGDFAQNILDDGMQYGYGISWPDTVPGNPSDIQSIIPAYNGKIGVWAETQSPAATDFSVAEVYDTALSYGATHIVWKQADYSLADPQSYLSQYVIPFLRNGNPPTVKSCPTNLSAGCNPQ